MERIVAGRGDGEVERATVSKGWEHLDNAVARVRRFRCGSGPTDWRNELEHDDLRLPHQSGQDRLLHAVDRIVHLGSELQGDGDQSLVLLPRAL